MKKQARKQRGRKQPWGAGTGDQDTCTWQEVCAQKAAGEWNQMPTLFSGLVSLAKNSVPSRSLQMA